MKLKNNALTLLVCLILVFFSSAPARSEEISAPHDWMGEYTNPYDWMEGKITDLCGNPLEGVRVKTETEATATDPDGYYRLYLRPEFVYLLTAELEGYKKFQTLVLPPLFLHIKMEPICDINRNGNIDLGDALLLLRIVAGETDMVLDVDGEVRIGLPEVIYVLGHLTN
jgi:hypothetical protein